MPCTDGGVPYPPSRDDFLDRRTSAMLCALFNVNEATMLLLVEGVNEREAGVTKAEIREWWKLHQAKDIARREREAAERKRMELRKAAFKKLTREELEALGLE